MGILADSEIRAAIKQGRLSITPFDEKAVQPASYDIHLGRKLILGDGTEWDLVDQGAYPIWKNTEMVLGTTYETFDFSPAYAASIGGKSSLGRAGVVVTPGAPWVDPGFRGELTMEITMDSVGPYYLTAYQGIAQLVFHQVIGVVEAPYAGKYQGQSGPTPDRTHTHMSTREVQDQIAEGMEAVALVNLETGEGVATGANALARGHVYNRERSEAEAVDPWEPVHDDGWLIKRAANILDDTGHMSQSQIRRLQELAELLNFTGHIDYMGSTQIEFASNQMAMAYALFGSATSEARQALVSASTWKALKDAQDSFSRARELLLADKQFKQQFPAARYTSGDLATS